MILGTSINFGKTRSALKFGGHNYIKLRLPDPSPLLSGNRKDRAVDTNNFWPSIVTLTETEIIPPTKKTTTFQQRT